MIILSKKRIMLVTSIIMVAMFTFVIQTNSRTTKVVQTVALPVSNKVIVLDAGHGKPDEGEYLLH